MLIGPGTAEQDPLALDPSRGAFRKARWAMLRPLGVGMAIFALAAAFPHASFCLFQRVTRLPCPACGGTRSLLALMRFEVVESIRWNPGLWAALAAFSAVFLLSGSSTTRTPAALRAAWIAGLSAASIRIGLGLYWPSSSFLHLAF